jgi:hypothetical protein
MFLEPCWCGERKAPWTTKRWYHRKGGMLEYQVADGLSYLVPDIIIMVVEVPIGIQKHFLNAYVASTLTDKAIDVIQNPRSFIPIQP